MKMKYGVALLLAALLAPFAGIVSALMPQGTDALNTAGSHEGGLVTRSAEAAVTAPYLLLRKGTGNNQVLIGTATARPLGAALDEALINTNVGVAILGGGNTVLMVASKAIAVDAPVYTTAGGKVTDTPVAGCWLVGYALTEATADGQAIEVSSHVPDAPYQPTGFTTHTGATGSVAVPITHRAVKLTTTGAHTATLANGVFVGQKLTIICVAYSGGAATLTPATGLEWSTFVFAVKGQRIDLEWTADGWAIVGFCYLTTLPVLTVP